MAKKFGKALFFTAIAGAIAAGGMAIYNKYKASTDDYDDDFLDFDDEDEDLDDLDDEETDSASDNDSKDREYVSIPRENASDDEAKVNVNVTIGDAPEEDDDEDTDEEESAASEDKVSDALFKEDTTTEEA